MRLLSDVLACGNGANRGERALASWALGSVPEWLLFVGLLRRTLEHLWPSAAPGERSRTVRAVCHTVASEVGAARPYQRIKMGCPGSSSVAGLGTRLNDIEQ